MTLKRPSTAQEASYREVNRIFGTSSAKNRMILRNKLLALAMNGKNKTLKANKRRNTQTRRRR